MKILFCLNRDIHSYVFLDELIKLIYLDADKALIESIFASNVFFTERVGSKYSQDNAYLDLLENCEMNIPNKLERYSTKAVYFSKFIDTYAFKMLSVKDFNKEQLAKEFAEIRPDIILSIRFGKIFNDSMIKAAACPIINIHSGILPDYKGILASFWSKKNHETEYGFTVHGIEDSGIDTGSIFYTERFKHDLDKCLFSTVHELYPSAAKFMKNFLVNFQINPSKNKSFKQDSSGAYFTKPALEDFVEYEKAGLKILDRNYYWRLIDQCF